MINKNSGEYYDITLSYGAEYRGKEFGFDCRLKEEMLRETGGFDVSAKYAAFIDNCDYLMEFEVEKRVAKQFSSKKYVGSWEFYLCDDCGKIVKKIKPVEGAVFMTDDESSNIMSKCSSKVSRNGVKLNRIELIDIVFVNVPRGQIGNLLDNAQHRNITMKNGRKLQDLLETYFYLHIITPPKSIVSGCNKTPIMPESLEMLNILAHQTNETDILEQQFNSKLFRAASKENISNYSDMHIVMSNCNITQQFYADFDGSDTREIKKADMRQRYKNIALSLFVVNIMVLKIAKLRLIQRAINACMNESLSEKTKLSKNDLLAINLYFADFTNSMYEKTFIYPATESIAEKVYEKFELGDIKTQLNDLQQTFERYMTLFFSNEEVKAEGRRQRILKTLTVLSGISTVCSLAGYIFSEMKLLLRISVFLGGFFAIAAIVYLIPYIIDKHKK